VRNTSVVVVVVIIIEAVGVYLLLLGRNSSLMVSKLDSRLEGCGFESHPILDGNSVKTMPGLIPAPKSWFFQLLKKKENIGSQMGHTNFF